MHITISTFAQAPQAFNYQGVVRDNTGLPVSNSNINLKALILHGDINGQVVFSESHNLITSDNGIFSIKIGRGTLIDGNFNSIVWNEGAHFLRIEVDFSGGNNFEFLGASQLLSVPYALYAENTNLNVGSGLDYNDDILTNSGDLDSLNEIQNLSLENDSLRISKSNQLGLNDINYWKQTSLVDWNKNYSLKSEEGNFDVLLNNEGITLNFDKSSDTLNVSRIHDNGNNLHIFSPNEFVVTTWDSNGNGQLSQSLEFQNNGNLKISGRLDLTNLFGGGFILRSDNNKCWQYKADNSGSLTSIEVTCP